MSAAEGQATSIPGSFNYLAPSHESSLYRNGKLFTRRDPDGGDGSVVGMTRERRVVDVANARETSCSLARHGFELVRRPLERPDLDFLEHEPVVTRYYDECIDVVRDVTGAARVFAFDHNVRSALGKQAQARIAEGQGVQGPARIVHGDYTLTSAPQRLRDLTQPPARNDTYGLRLGDRETLLDRTEVEHAIAQGRFALINVWRNIAHEPVFTDPLALCAAHSVEPEDLVVFEIRYEDRIGENYFAKHADRHRWFFYPQLTRDEALLIKQWDSAGPLARSEGRYGDGHAADAPCTFSFHSAFKDETVPDDAPDRWSIEVRCAVLYD